MKLNKKILMFIFSICVTFSLLISSFRIICFNNENFLISLYDKYNVYVNMPFHVEKNDVKNLSKTMMDYLNNKIDDMSYIVNNNEKEQDFFSERTKIHFYDVKKLMNNLIFISYVTTAISIILFLYLRKKCSFKQYLQSLIFEIILFIIFAIIIYVNFNSFFIQFHLMFFNNDYWLLDPNKDYIINLLPEILFKDITIQILKLFSILLVLLSILLGTQFHQEAK